MRRLLIVIMFILSHQFCFAQALTITDVTTTESTCPENGTATVTATGGDTSQPYQYAITVGPKTFPFQLSNVFTTLPPGNYTFVVLDNAGTQVSLGEEVTGNYQLMNPTLSETGYTCENANDGTITVNVTDGLTPYQFSLIAPSVEARPLQTSNLFENLVEGDYTVQTLDDCGNIQTRMITVSGWTDPITRWANNSGITKICGAPQMYELSLYWGGGPIYEADSLVFRIYDAATNVPLVEDTLVYGTIPTFTLPAPTDLDQGYRIENYDPVCDRIKATITLDLDEPVLSTVLIPVENSCDLFDVLLRTTSRNNKEQCDDTDWRITDTDTNLDLETATTNTRNPGVNGYNYTFSDIPSGNYEACYTNCCGEEFCTTFVVEAPEKILSYSLAPRRACICETSEVIINARNFSLPYDIILESAPTSITTTDGTFSNNFASGAVLETVTSGSNNYRQWTNLGVGTYVFRVEDACDSIKKITVDITAADLRIYDFTVEIISGCVDAHKVRVNWTDNTAGNWSPDIIIDGTQVNPNEQFAATQTVEYVNLSSGNLTVNIEARGLGTPLYSSCPNILSFTDVIEYYEQPEIINVYSYTCEDGSGIIISEGSKGFAPYIYELSQGGSIVQTQVSNGVFFVSSSGTYDLRLIDACLNSNNVSISSGALSIPTITSVSTCTTNNDTITSLTLSTDEIFDGLYEWKDPNGAVVSDSSKLIIDSFSTTDEGTYTLKIALASSPICVEATSTIIVDPVLCISLPIELTFCNQPAKSHPPQPSKNTPP